MSGSPPAPDPGLYTNVMATEVYIKALHRWPPGLQLGGRHRHGGDHDGRSASSICGSSRSANSRRSSDGLPRRTPALPPAHARLRRNGRASGTSSPLVAATRPVALLPGLSDRLGLRRLPSRRRRRCSRPAVTASRSRTTGLLSSGLLPAASSTACISASRRWPPRPSSRCWRPMSSRACASASSGDPVRLGAARPDVSRGSSWSHRSSSCSRSWGCSTAISAMIFVYIAVYDPVLGLSARGLSRIGAAAARRSGDHRRLLALPAHLADHLPDHAAGHRRHRHLRLLLCWTRVSLRPRLPDEDRPQDHAAGALCSSSART